MSRFSAPPRTRDVGGRAALDVQDPRSQVVGRNAGDGEDFVFAYGAILNPKTAAQYANILYPIKNAQKVSKGKVPVEQLGVSAPDAKTFVIDLEHPAPYLPQLLTHYTSFPLPQHVVENTPAIGRSRGNMVSNGPYMLAEWRPHDHVKLVKNPKFWDAANVKIDEVVFIRQTTIRRRSSAFATASSTRNIAGR